MVQGLLRAGTFSTFFANVASVGLHYTGFFPIISECIKQRVDLFTGIGRHDLDKGLHTPLQIAAQQVAGADEETLILSIKITLYRMSASSKIAAALAYAADKGKDVLCHARPQAADAPDKELDLYARAGTFNQFFHNVNVIHRIALDGDASVRPLCYLPIEKFHQTGFEGQRSEPEGMCYRRDFPAAQGSKGSLGFKSFCFSGSDKGEICVLFARDLVIVSGSYLGNVADAALMPACDNADFGVNFVARQPVDHAAACILQHLGIVDVVLLVKACAEFKKAQNVFALIGGIGQGCGDFAAG